MMHTHSVRSYVPCSCWIKLLASVCFAWPVPVGALEVVILYSSMPSLATEQGGPVEHPLGNLAEQLARRNHAVSTVELLIGSAPKFLVPRQLHGVAENKISALESETELLGRLQEGFNLESWYSASAKEFSGDWLTIRSQLLFSACPSVLNEQFWADFKKSRYDVAIVDSDDPCMVVLAHLGGRPYLLFDRAGFSPELALDAGLTRPLEMLLNEMRGSDHSMTLKNRVVYAILWLKKRMVELWEAVIDLIIGEGARDMGWTRKKLDQFLDSFLRKLPVNDESTENAITLDEIRSRAHGFIANSDAILQQNDAAVDHRVLLAGGLNVEHPRMLLSPWEEIGFGASGRIVVSLGTLLNVSRVPRRLLAEFVETVRKMPEYLFIVHATLPADSSLAALLPEELPSNVHLAGFLPQLDLLCDENTVLLISHGSVDSLTEAVHCGVPVLGVSLIESNERYLKQLDKYSVAKLLQRHHISNETLTVAIRQLAAKRIRQRAKELSLQHKDRLLSPVDAISMRLHYATSHPNLNSLTRLLRPSRMSFWSYYCLDVCIVLIGSVIGVITVALVIMWRVILILRILGESRVLTAEKEKKRRILAAKRRAVVEHLRSSNGSVLRGARQLLAAHVNNFVTPAARGVLSANGHGPVP